MNRLQFVLLFGLFSLLLADSATKSADVVSASTAGDWRFGVIESYEDPQEATNLGASWTRVVFQWAEVQAGGAGTWTSKVSDDQINNEINNGRMVVGLLIGIPGWAIGDNGIPRGLWLPHDDPGNAWATFVREAVSRYQGRINHWIIWNEPDIGTGAIAHTWGGSVKDFFQLQRTAYLVAKEVNPAAIIHLAAFTFWADANAGREQYMARLLDEILADPAAAQHNYYFDVATAHLYFQTTQIYDLLGFFLGLMRQRGMTQPIWLVETNVPPFDDPAWPVSDPFLAATQEEQAAFMPQVVASALAAGAQRIAIYKMKDTLTDRAANPEPFGLIRMDGSRRPAFTTYQTAIRTLSGMTGARRERWDGVGQIRISQGEGSTTVLFSRLPTGQLAQVSATFDTAVLADMWGNRRVVTAVDGVFTVELPAASCTQSVADYCMVGGTTYYLIQSPGLVAPTNTPTATPTDTATPTITPIRTTTPTSTATPTSSATFTSTATPPSTATEVPSPRPSNTATALPTSTETSTAGPVAELAWPVTSATEIPHDVSKLTRNETGLYYVNWIVAAGGLLAIGVVTAWLVRRRRQ